MSYIPGTCFNTSLADVLEVINAVQRNGTEITLLYPPDDGQEDAWSIIQTAVDALGADGQGAIFLASGIWRLAQPVTISCGYVALVGTGPQTVIKPDAGIDAFEFAGRTAGANPTYVVQDMAFFGGRSAIRTTDPGGGRVLLECVFERLFCYQQEQAGFDLGLAVYRSSWRNVHILGEGGIFPAYGIDFSSTTAGSNNNKLDRCTIRGTDQAAIHAGGTTPSGKINDLTIDTCLIESNLGPAAVLNDCNHIRFNGGWFENNCIRVEAETVPQVNATNSMGIELNNVWSQAPGAGAKDAQGYDTIIRTDAPRGHVFSGRLSGSYVDFGTGFPYLGVKGAPDNGTWVEMSCRQQLMPDATGAWFPVGLSSAVAVVPT